jgi:hypothetical protein
MDIPQLAPFRLVGGTLLSLLLGHRKSVDIDLFTDAEYGSIDFLEILSIIEKTFNYVDATNWSNEYIGNSCFIGANPREVVKLDMYYSEPFNYPIIQLENIRLSRLEEIAAMKLDVIGRGGRKKDFWDIHMLLEQFNLKQLIGFYKKKYPYGFSEAVLRNQLANFDSADSDFDPVCLKGKYWELIKLDLIELVKK